MSLKVSGSVWFSDGSFEDHKSPPGSLMAEVPNLLRQVCLVWTGRILQNISKNKQKKEITQVSWPQRSFSGASSAKCRWWWGWASERWTTTERAGWCSRWSCGSAPLDTVRDTRETTWVSWRPGDYGRRFTGMYWPSGSFAPSGFAPPGPEAVALGAEARWVCPSRRSPDSCWYVLQPECPDELSAKSGNTFCLRLSWKRHNM